MDISVLSAAICIVFANASPPDFYLKSSRKSLGCKIAPHLIEQSNKNGLDPTLMMGLISVESNWNKDVVSKANACGLTQVIPKYTGKITRKYTCKDLKNPRHSINAGTKILKYWIRWHKGDIKRGLCAYNAGYRCGGKNPNKHGMRYARKVLRMQKKFQKLIEKTELK